jgi:hypothetical protein
MRAASKRNTFVCQIRSLYAVRDVVVIPIQWQRIFEIRDTIAVIVAPGLEPRTVLGKPFPAFLQGPINEIDTLGSGEL